MSLLEYYISALRCLGANKLRTVLTTLGIIVGISSVILINTLGSSLGETINDTVGKMFGSSVVAIIPMPENLVESALDDFDDLYEGDVAFPIDLVEAYEKRYNGKIKKVVTEMDSTSIAGRLTTSTAKNAIISISGSNDMTWDNGLSLNLYMVSGRFVSEEDVLKAKPVIVIDRKLAELYFGEEDPIGKEISFSLSRNRVYDSYTVVGIYDYKMDNDIYMGDSEMDYHISYTTNTYLESFIGNFGFMEMEKYMMIYNIDKVSDEKEFVKDTKEYFDEYLAGTGWETRVITLNQLTGMLKSIVSTVTAVIAGIAAISLFVGGVGVMNVMLVSVTERTMEIGVRKAMGASDKSIRIQFLIESVMIVLTGSAIGILLGLFNAKLIALISVKVTAYLDIPLSISLTFPLKSLLESLAFSFVVGVVFGVYPANKAAKMEVIDALRFE